MDAKVIDSSAIKRAELVPILTAAAVNIATRLGKEEKFTGVLGYVLIVEFDGIKVLYRTPKAMIFTAPSAFGIDIWHGKKCFSVIWNSPILKDFEVVNFKRGPWIPTLLSFSERLSIAK